MPNKPGAFLKACQVIRENDGNIIRVSYNEGVNLFIEVMASDAQLDAIEEGLGVIAYVETPKEPDNMRIVVKINDVPGALYPVLEIFKKYKINITYLNSFTENREFQHFSFGFNIENYDKVTRTLLDISKIYLLNITKYVGKDKELDTIVEYIRGANNLQTLFSFQDYKALDYIKECTVATKRFAKMGKDPTPLLTQMDQVMKFISFHSGINFNPKMTKYELSPESDLYCFEPPCGSNSYIVKSGDKLLFVDTGMGIFSEEMIMEYRELFPAYYSMEKIVIPTHADVYHCGLIDDIERAKILVTENTYKIFQQLYKPMPEFDNEEMLYRAAFNRISRIITDFHIPAKKKCKILKNNGKGPLDKIYSFKFGDLEFDLYEGIGGHIPGETMVLCRNKKVVFTGGVFGKEMEINKNLAETNGFVMPADVDRNEKYVEAVKKELKRIGDEIGMDGMLVCYGHGSPKRF